MADVAISGTKGVTLIEEMHWKCQQQEAPQEGAKDPCAPFKHLLPIRRKGPVDPPKSQHHSSLMARSTNV